MRVPIRVGGEWSCPLVLVEAARRPFNRTQLEALSGLGREGPQRFFARARKTIVRIVSVAFHPRNFMSRISSEISAYPRTNARARKALVERVTRDDTDVSGWYQAAGNAIESNSRSSEPLVRAKCKFGHVILNRPSSRRQTAGATGARASIKSGTRFSNAIDVKRRAIAE